MMPFLRKRNESHDDHEGADFHPGDKVPMSAGANRNPGDEYQNIMMEKQVFEILNKKTFLSVLPSDTVEKIVQVLQKI